MTNVDAGEAVSLSSDDSGPAANSVELAVIGRIGVVGHEQETLDADAEFPVSADPVDFVRTHSRCRLWGWLFMPKSRRRQDSTSGEAATGIGAGSTVPRPVLGYLSGHLAGFAGELHRLGAASVWPRPT